MKENTKKLVCTALFTALIFIGTKFIQIPLLNGYFNAGDCFILVLGWVIGGGYGMIGAAVGAGLADLLSEYAVYTPATIVIKAAMALVAYLGYKLVMNKSKPMKMAGYAVSSVVAELIMVAGYFVFESVLYGVPAAVGTLVGNFLQGGVAIALGLILISVLEGTKMIDKIRK